VYKTRAKVASADAMRQRLGVDSESGGYAIPIASTPKATCACRRTASWKDDRAFLSVMEGRVSWLSWPNPNLHGQLCTLCC
jgi:hypothetical protein